MDTLSSSDHMRSVMGRSALLLRILAKHEPDGVRTSQAGREAGLPRPTTHRLLGELQSQGLADRNTTTGAWVLGPEIYFMGLAASSRYDVRELAHPVVRGLADNTGESAFFSARRGLESICLIREDGAFPIRSHVLFEGARFPLGVASAGMAFLTFMHDRDIVSYLEREDLTEDWGDQHSAARIRERINESRHAGWVLNPGLVVPGSWGMAAAVFDVDGEARWALSLTGIEHRFDAARQPGLGRLLLSEAHRLTQILGAERSAQRLHG